MKSNFKPDYTISQADERNLRAQALGLATKSREPEDDASGVHQIKRAEAYLKFLRNEPAN